MTQDINVIDKIKVLIKISLIVMWFYAVDILLVYTISVFFNDSLEYRTYILNNQYMISFISKVICFIGLVITTKKYKVIPGNRESEVNIYKIVRYIIYGLIGWGISTIIVNILLPVFPEYDQINTLFEGDEHLFRFIAIVIMAPFIEEYIFRGKIQEYLKSEFGNMPAIILQAVIFGALHGLIIQQIYAFVLGVYLGYIKNKEDNFISTFTMHMIINAIGWYIGIMSV